LSSHTRLRQIHWRFARTEQAILDSIRTRPSARSVAVAYDHPLEANWSESLALVGDVTAEEERRQVELRIVSPVTSKRSTSSCSTDEPSASAIRSTHRASRS
jgi:hypothetical protein